mmetsp:Transcript_69841/g.138203  ORF Transcript_69841/g.138203 Transcript_69841/m.138203 type:complete len:114 (+) Transcript_69841:123-464(+)
MVNHMSSAEFSCKQMPHAAQMSALQCNNAPHPQTMQHCHPGSLTTAAWLTLQGRGALSALAGKVSNHSSHKHITKERRNDTALNKQQKATNTHKPPRKNSTTIRIDSSSATET